jgi:hypothetical protein
MNKSAQRLDKAANVVGVLGIVFYVVYMGLMAVQLACEKEGPGAPGPSSKAPPEA